MECLKDISKIVSENAPNLIVLRFQKRIYYLSWLHTTVIVGMQQTFEAEARSDKQLAKKYELQFCQSAASVSLK